MLKYLKIVNFIEKICLIGSTVSLLAIMSLTTFEVISRKVFNLSIPSLYEFTTDYLMVALVFLPLSNVYINGGQIRVTLFLKYVPKAFMPVMERLLDLLALLLFVVIAILGWNNAVRAFQFHELSSSLLAYPMGPAYLLVPIGAGMLSIRIIHSLIFQHRGNLDQESQHSSNIDQESSIKVHQTPEVYVD